MSKIFINCRCIIFSNQLQPLSRSGKVSDAPVKFVIANTKQPADFSRTFNVAQVVLAKNTERYFLFINQPGNSVFNFMPGNGVRNFFAKDTFIFGNLFYFSI